MYYVIFDSETNGLDVSTSDVLSLGWLKVKVDEDYTITKHVERYVLNDDIHNSQDAFAVNNITDEFRHENGIPIEDILNEFRLDIDGCILYAFSHTFDVQFLKKYDPTIFDNASSVDELSINERESVLNAVQRIIADINHGTFNIRPRNCHYHTAYDDCYCELIILLHDILKIPCIRDLFEECDEYAPRVGSGCHKNKPIDALSDNTWIEWFLNVKVSPHEDYLRRYIRSHNIVK